MSDMMMGDLRRMARADGALTGSAGICASALVLTALGKRPLGEIEAGDRLVSRTAGMIRVASTDRFTCEAAPIVLAPHALGDGRPSDLLHVSPSQLILLRDWRARILYGAACALVPAEDLVDQKYITRSSRLADVEMVRLGFEAPQILYVGMLECAFEPEARSSTA